MGKPHECKSHTIGLLRSASTVSLHENACLLVYQLQGVVVLAVYLRRIPPPRVVPLGPLHHPAFGLFAGIHQDGITYAM